MNTCRSCVAKVLDSHGYIYCVPPKRCGHHKHHTYRVNHGPHHPDYAGGLSAGNAGELSAEGAGYHLYLYPAY